MEEKPHSIQQTEKETKKIRYDYTISIIPYHIDRNSNHLSQRNWRNLIIS